MEFVKRARTQEQLDTMRIIESRLVEIDNLGYADCRFCRKRFYGQTVGIVLHKLGEHSDEHNIRELAEHGKAPDC